MTNHSETSSGNTSGLVVQERESGGFDYRRSDAQGVEDPHVSIYVDHLEVAGRPANTFVTHGVRKYDDYQTYGEGASSPVGVRARIEATTDLLDEEGKARFAERLAILTFELSAGNQG